MAVKLFQNRAYARRPFRPPDRIVDRVFFEVFFCFVQKKKNIKLKKVF